jgi:hypothetical protein
MAENSRKTASSYDEILRRTVPNPDTSMRPSREEELLARHRFGEPTEHRPRPLTPSESVTLERVQRALILDPSVDLRHVSVNIDFRCAVLVGDVPGEATSVRIEEIAGSVEGVDTVDNQLVVRSVP